MALLLKLRLRLIWISIEWRMENLLGAIDWTVSVGPSLPLVPWVFVGPSKASAL